MKIKRSWRHLVREQRNGSAWGEDPAAFDLGLILLPQQPPPPNITWIALYNVIPYFFQQCLTSLCASGGLFPDPVQGLSPGLLSSTHAGQASTFNNSGGREDQLRRIHRHWRFRIQLDSVGSVPQPLGVVRLTSLSLTSRKPSPSQPYPRQAKSAPGLA